jgi:hypothetical protein
MRYFLLAIFLSCGLRAPAQQITSISSSAQGMSGTARFTTGLVPVSAIVAGAPYSADQISEHVQTLADGTHISQQNVREKMFRDSMGRTRVERPLGVGSDIPNAANRPLLVEITDPLAHVRYTLDTVNKIAHRSQLPNNQPAIRKGQVIASSGPIAPALIGGGLARPAGVGTAATQPVRPELKNEKLGQQTIEGLLADGTRITQTYAVNSIGNDRPISVVSEIWTSPVLKVTILNKNDDPRYGVGTTKLINISQGEPAADLFQAPPDYQIVDETGDFTIQWGTNPPPPAR